MDDDQTEIDLNNNTFVNYQEYPTQQGLFWKNAKDAMFFNSFHEGIHIELFWALEVCLVLNYLSSKYHLPYKTTVILGPSA
jgi:hypothetical protein